MYTSMIKWWIKLGEIILEGFASREIPFFGEERL